MTAWSKLKELMTNVRQLELSLEYAFEVAADVPETADVLGLWQQFEGELSALPQQEQLRVAGDVFMQLAGLCETKSEVLWEDWQDAHNAEGPVMGGDWLLGVTRQTQELDFSDLVNRSYRLSSEASNEHKSDEDSVAGDVDKLSVFDMIDALEATDTKREALAVSHSENISDWVKALAGKQKNVPQRLVDIQQQLQMPMVEVWIAALLGGFPLEQRGSFYQTQEVWIGR